MLASTKRCSNITDYCLGTRRGGLFPFIGEGIFIQDGAPWRHSRELLRRPFSKTHYQDLRGFTEHIDDLIGRLFSFGEGEVVDLQPLSFHFTLATTTALIFGQPIEGTGVQDEDDFSKSFDCALLISSWRTRLQDFHWIYNPQKYRTACKNVKEYADRFIRRTLLDKAKGAPEDPAERYAFVEDVSAELQDPALIRDQLINVLLAGRDTTACLLSWTLWIGFLDYLPLLALVAEPSWTNLFLCSFLLVRHPLVLRRLQVEISSILGEEAELTRSQIQQMNYLECLLNESRLL